MKVFTAKGVHLANLAVPAKLVYTLFLVFIALGVASSVLIYATRIGAPLRGPEPSVAARYLDQKAKAPDEAGGPSLDLPGADDGGAQPAAKASEDLKWPWILDVFHQHLFTVSVVFLILAHLFMLTRLAAWLSGTVITVSGLSSLAHVLAPVIIHLTGGWLWLMPLTGSLMGASWAFMILWGLAAMWLGWGRRAA